jgi:hypothetical protein
MKAFRWTVLPLAALCVVVSLSGQSDPPPSQISQQRILAEVGACTVQLSVAKDYVAQLEAQLAALKKTDKKPE